VIRVSLRVQNLEENLEEEEGIQERKKIKLENFNLPKTVKDFAIIISNYQNVQCRVFNYQLFLILLFC
jgi:hypothetical protein